MMALAAMLVLQPVLAEEGELRLVATGFGDGAVTWTLDGATVATTSFGEAAVVPAAAGPHVVFAHHRGDGWQALVRPEPQAPGQAVWAPAWTAASVPPVRAAPGPQDRAPLGLTLEAHLAPMVGTGALLALAAGALPRTKRP